MKKTVLVLLAILLTSSIALADWKDSFLTDYTTSGLNAAVTNALAHGIAPEAIIVTAMAIEGMNGVVLATAMCDGAVSIQALQDSLNVLGISQQVAITSCGGQGNISATGAFPGATYSSANKEIIFSDKSGVIGGRKPVPSASGNNFSR